MRSEFTQTPIPKTPGALLAEVRARHGVSQEQLAIRAGTTQSAISRIEKDAISPSLDTLGGLLYLMGEDLVLDSEVRDAGIDASLNRQKLGFAPIKRLEEGLAFSDFVRRNRGERTRRQAA